ncbi:MAG: transmembrane 220 family protein [Chitinophagaceae bacterium]|nr:transmembrane 220 family protein [Chitinophagaceae bacterium]
MKALNITLAVLFVVCAALQYNDPDPYVWVPIYIYAAYLCWLAGRNKFYPKAYWLGVIVYLSYAAYLFFDKNGVLSWATEHHAENIAATMKAEKPWIEETREFGGLIIVFAAMLMNLLYSRKFRLAPK